jgi:acetyl-CoA C-acetyltransferase
MSFYMRKVAVVGVGTGKFSNRAYVSLPELAWEAIKEALDDARLGPEDVQRFVVGNVGGWSSETLPAVVVGEHCGLVPKAGLGWRRPAPRAPPR